MPGTKTGQCRAWCKLQQLRQITTRELDTLAAETIRVQGATSNFLGYGADVGPPFPGVICTSINEETIHGIPSDRALREGDLLSIDCGAVVDGWHADAATTVAIGAVPDAYRELMRVTEEALRQGIEAMRTGRRVRDITKAISAKPDIVVSSLSRFSITVTNKGKGKAGPSVLTITNVGTFTVPGLAPGGSATFSWSTCRIATYSAVVDRTNAVAESDESNNTASLENTCS